MVRNWPWIIVFAAATGGFAGGCSGPGAQLTNCQQDKDQLLATIREQRDANRTLQTQVASLETRLGESEKELARGGQPGTRLSSRPPAAGSKKSVEAAQLPWRGQTKTGESPTKPTKTSSTGNKSPLADLAARDKRLAYDARAGVATLDLPLAFAENKAALSAESRRQLDDVAKLLKSKEAADLKVKVSGFAEGRDLATDRAQAVADYLDSHGIAQERLSATSGGSRAGSGVQITLGEAPTTLRR